MTSLDSIFFPKGGFSSSHLDESEISRGIDGINSLHPNYPMRDYRFGDQNKAERDHQKTKGNFST